MTAKTEPASPGFVIEKKQDDWGSYEPQVFGSLSGSDRSSVKLILVHPSCALNLAGACQIQCLVGQVQLLAYYLSGCDYKQENLKPFCFASPFPPVIITVVQKEGNPLVGQEKVLKARLAAINIEYDAIKACIRRGYAAALVVKEPLANIKRLENVSGSELFKPCPENYVSKEVLHCLYMTAKSTNLFTGEPFDEFRAFFRDVNAKWKSQKVTTTMAIGGKNTGKSTTLKVLTNAWSSKAEANCSIYYMDCDVGQSEFTPPGLISLHKITDAILSVPFGSQLSTFSRSYYYGSITPESNIVLYKNIINKVYADFLSLSAVDEHALLVVNTLGWVYDLGAEILDHMMGVIRPDLLLGTENGVKRNFNIDYLIDKHFVGNNADRTKSSVARNLAITGYLAKCFNVKPSDAPILSFSEVPARMVSFEAISIFIHPAYPVSDKCYLAALNMSTVALCSIIPEFRNMYDHERLLGRDHLPRKLMVSKEIREDSPQQPFLKCHGFALVRAISIEKKKIYIITPTDPEELKNVTVFAIGEQIITPKCIYETQNAVNAPYLMQTAGKSDHFDKLSVPMQLISTPKRTFINRK